MTTLTLLLFALLAFQPEKCAKLEVTLSTPTVSGGQGVGVYNRVTNCGDRKANFAVDTEVISACGEVTVILASDPSDGKQLEPGFAFVQPIGYAVPFDACPGTYTVSSEVRSGRKVLDSRTVNFEVTE